MARIWLAFFLLAGCPPLDQDGDPDLIPTTYEGTSEVQLPPSVTTPAAVDETIEIEISGTDVLIPTAFCDIAGTDLEIIGGFAEVNLDPDASGCSFEVDEGTVTVAVESGEVVWTDEDLWVTVAGPGSLDNGDDAYTTFVFEGLVAE